MSSTSLSASGCVTDTMHQCSSLRKKKRYTPHSLGILTQLHVKMLSFLGAGSMQHEYENYAPACVPISSAHVRVRVLNEHVLCAQ